MIGHKLCVLIVRPNSLLRVLPTETYSVICQTTPVSIYLLNEASIAWGFSVLRLPMCALTSMPVIAVTAFACAWVKVRPNCAGSISILDACKRSLLN